MVKKESPLHRLMTPMAALFIVAASVSAADSVKSGLEVGESAGVCHIKDATGPNKGKSHCYR